MINRVEDNAIGKAERSRARAATSARHVQVRDMAKEAINAFVTSLPEEDRCEAMNAATRHLRTLYGAGEGEREAVSLFGSLAWSAELQTRAAIARAAAEKAFSTQAANDREPG